jgi:DNA polymerase
LNLNQPFERVSNTKDFIDKVERFIRQQQEIYGDFSVEIAQFQQNQTSHSDSEQNSDNDNTVEASISEPQEASSAKSKSELSLNEKITACQTLDELRALCKESKELRTDLDGTNLVFGVGNPKADLMVIGEAPGYNEDQQGEPFVGEAGQLLDKIMAAINFSRKDIYIANILKHRPPNNRDPKPDERQRSLPFLMRQIELVDPKLILCVGKISATTLLNEETSLSKLRSKIHSFHGRELMATYHPAALLRNPKWKRPTWEDVQKLRNRYDELGGK